jgi:hypothetical protein
LCISGHSLHGSVGGGGLGMICLYSGFAGEEVERAVVGPLQAGRVYGCHVIVTSSSSAPQHLDVLCQVPQASEKDECGNRDHVGLPNEGQISAC